MDYGLTYDNYCNYMVIDRVWGDLVMHFVLTKLLPISYTIVTPFNEVTFKKEKSSSNPFNYEIVVVYNGKHHYISTCK